MRFSFLMASRVKPSSVTPREIRGLPALLIFGLAVVGPALWAWVPRPPAGNPVFLKDRQEIPGYEFQAIPLSQQVVKTLATSDLLNGHFWDAGSNRFSVFRASWQPGQGTIDNAIRHTPEICWVDAGFRILNLGAPSQVTLDFSGQPISFQCRILKHPALAAPEITLWATCLDGRWDVNQQGPPANPPGGSVTVFTHLRDVWTIIVTQDISLRQSREQAFTQHVRKQFLRFSIPVTTDWQAALTDLERFGQLWLELQPQP